MPEQQLGNLAAPGHLLAGAQGRADALQVVGGGVVGGVGYGHVGIEEAQGLLLRGRGAQSLELIKLRPDEPHLGLESRVHALPAGGVGDEVLGARGQTHHGQEHS